MTLVGRVEILSCIRGHTRTGETLQRRVPSRHTAEISMRPIKVNTVGVREGMQATTERIANDRESILINQWSA